MPKRDQPVVEPRAPGLEWLRQFVTPSLIEAAPYKIDTPEVAIKLDQNESPWDLPVGLKEKVLKKLVARSWNRYPSAFADDLGAKVARYIGVQESSVLLGPGSNYLVSLVLSVFAKGATRVGSAAKVVIARPSFPLYESHCRYEGIPYEIWPLDEALEYDTRLLPKLTDGSLVVFASPNNPVGNVLPKAELKQLLTQNPKTLFVADEAYFEYAKDPYTDLLAQHANLLLLRTFSKTMGAAGVRIGYVVGHQEYLGLLRKLRLPYLLNHFSLACAEVLLDDTEMQEHLSKVHMNAVRQRAGVADALGKIGETSGFYVKPSEANFLLLRWSDQARAQKTYKGLIQAGILVRDISGNPGLSGCLRITLGNEQENTALIQAMQRLA